MSQRGVIAYMNQVFGGKTVSGLSENELLGRFVATGDETAFTALVIRHGPMVLGVCRRFLRDIDDVEDAFQATFLVLARRAGAIQRRHLLAPWLHGVAHRVAVRARAKGATRNARELALEFAPEAEAPRDSSPPEELVAKELRGILDDELARLPEALRKPIVLCYLEGMTHDEAARELRWPVGTVRSRMARARSLLRNRLARQGHSASGMALVGNLAREVVPRTLLEATVRASLGFTTGKIPASATALALAKGVLGLMMLQKAMIAGVVVLAATVTVAGAFGYQAGGLGTGSSSASEPPKEQDEASNRNAKKAVSFSDAPLSEQVMALERGLQETTDKINTLQDDYKKLQWELDALRPKPANPGMGMGGMAGMMGGRGTGQPGGMMRGMMSGRGGGAANAGQGMMGMMGAMRGVDRRAMMMGGPAGPDEDHLAFVREQSLIYLVSPEGNRVTAYDMGTGKSSVIEFDKGLKAVPVAMGLLTAIGFEPIGAKSEVKRLAIFDKLPDGVHLNPGQKGSAWMTKDLAIPFKGTVVPAQLTNGVYFELGNQIHAYSQRHRTWSELTLPDGPHAAPTVDNNLLIYEADGHLHVFDTFQGKWTDINSRDAKAQAKKDKPDETKTP